MHSCFVMQRKEKCKTCWLLSPFAKAENKRKMGKDKMKNEREEREEWWNCKKYEGVSKINDSFSPARYLALFLYVRLCFSFLCGSATENKGLFGTNETLFFCGCPNLWWFPPFSCRVCYPEETESGTKKNRGKRSILTKKLPSNFVPLKCVHNSKGFNI